MNIATTDIIDKHRAELHASGLTDETIAAARIRSVQANEVRAILGWQPKAHGWGSGWAIPFDPPDADKPYCRAKLDWPRHNGKGQPIKYESPRGAPNRAYFPPGFDELCRADETIIFTEGEKKALAVSQLGLPCIGLVGVWGWQEKRQRSDTGKTFGRRRLISDLKRIDWAAKRIVIAFDSDAVTKSEVQLAEARLAEVLFEQDAEVRVARLPSDGNDKVGCDDFIVAHGEEAFRQILSAAKVPELPAKLAPMDWAKLFIEEFLTDPQGCALRWWRDEFYQWTGTHYVRLPESELTAIVFRWLDSRRTEAKPRHAAEVVKALASLAHVDFAAEVPCFLGTRRADVSNIISFPNGLLDISNLGGDLEMHAHRPAWFGLTCLAYPFDASADCPAWLRFLHEVINDDASIDLLQRWFGLCLTLDTSFQKLLLMIGPKRSGKGTVLRVLQHILGTDACVSPTLSSLAGDFGLWQLLGKSVVMFPDAHLGRRVDTIRVVELIKSIVGEDSVSVNRKNLPFLPNCRLRVRFIITVNELPRFTDTTLALEARILPLVFPNSFAGREDRTLEHKLKVEASGILNWAIGGLHKVRRDGAFTLPERSSEVLGSYRRLASPVLGFIDDRCEQGTEAEVATDALFEAWRSWCSENGHEAGSQARFGEHLRSAVPGVRRVRKHDRGAGRRWYVYTGIRLLVPSGP